MKNYKNTYIEVTNKLHQKGGSYLDYTEEEAMLIDKMQTYSIIFSGSIYTTKEESNKFPAGVSELLTGLHDDSILNILKLKIGLYSSLSLDELLSYLTIIRPKLQHLHTLSLPILSDDESMFDKLLEFLPRDLKCIDMRAFDNLVELVNKIIVKFPNVNIMVSFMIFTASNHLTKLRMIDSLIFPPNAKILVRPSITIGDKKSISPSIAEAIKLHFDSLLSKKIRIIFDKNIDRVISSFLLQHYNLEDLIIDDDPIEAHTVFELKLKVFP